MSKEERVARVSRLGGNGRVDKGKETGKVQGWPGLAYSSCTHSMSRVARVVTVARVASILTVDRVWRVVWVIGEGEDGHSDMVATANRVTMVARVTKVSRVTRVAGEVRVAREVRVTRVVRVQTVARVTRW